MGTPPGPGGPQLSATVSLGCGITAGPEDVISYPNCRSPVAGPGPISPLMPTNLLDDNTLIWGRFQG